MNIKENYWNESVIECHFYHRFFDLPVECVIDCSHQGECDKDVERWEKKTALNYWTITEKREGLSEYGAWSREELNGMDETELNQKILWISCCDAKEENKLEG